MVVSWQNGLVVMHEETVGGRENTERQHDLEYGTTGICREMVEVVDWIDDKRSAVLEDEQTKVDEFRVTVGLSVECA